MSPLPGTDSAAITSIRLTPHGEPQISNMVFARGVTAYLGSRPPQPYQLRVRLEARR